ncbi:MAG: Nif3-like dinuclear metal center hexameric protein [Phycisphaeraceae bacterium]|nr:Nif3-like dinuclear metal center hexameric protein [Phycisphaeraceae bacterium]
MTVQQIIDALTSFCPLEAAEPWDPVGLALGDGQWPVRQVLLALDLTAPVAAEACALQDGMLIVYHPPIFKPLARLTAADARQRSLLRLAAAKVAVFSPHTALDSAPGGIADFLADMLEPKHIESLPRKADDKTSQYKLVTFIPVEHADMLRARLAEAGAGRIGNYEQCSFSIPGRGSFQGNEQSNPVIGQAGQLEYVEELRMELIVAGACLGRALEALRTHHPYEEPAFDVYPLANPTIAGLPGVGRVVEFDPPRSADRIAELIQEKLGVSHCPVTPGARPDAIATMAICPGAGVSVLRQARGVDAWLTGEMRYHDILEARESGLTLFLPGHAQTERPYLPTLAEKLNAALDRSGAGVRVEIASTER